MAAPKNTTFEDPANLRGKMQLSGKTGGDLDTARRLNTAYEYLCHLEEARKWIEACLHIELPPATEMEEYIRNGVVLGRLSMFFAPEVVKPKNIYDLEMEVYKERGLVFRHTDNCSQLFKAMRSIKFPEIFFPETTDIYDKKNMPRVIYCIHALSRYLYHLGIAPEIEDLHGIAQFTEEEITAMDAALKKAGVSMPTFGKIGGILAKEIGEDDAAMHAAILILNQGLEREAPAEEVRTLMEVPACGLKKIDPALQDQYRDRLIARRKEKISHIAPDSTTEEADVYDSNLTKSEIQNTINAVNNETALLARDKALKEINVAIDGGNDNALFGALQNPNAAIVETNEDNAPQYMFCLARSKSQMSVDLNQKQIQEGVVEANSLSAHLESLRAALRNGDPEAQFQALQALSGKDLSSCKDHLLSRLRSRFLADPRMSLADLFPMIEESLKFGTALRALNDAIEQGDAEGAMTCMKDPILALQDVDDAGAYQYLYVLQLKKQTKNGDLTIEEVQGEISAANKAAEDNAKHAAAIFAINEAVRAGTSAGTLTSLQNTDAHLTDVQAPCAERYQSALAVALHNKEQSAGHGRKWKKFTTDTGRDYYYNKETKETQWVPPADLGESDLTQEEIQEVVNAANKEQARADLFQSKESEIVVLQSHIRGYLVRKQFKQRLNFINDQSSSIVHIQSLARMFLMRKRYLERLRFLNAQSAPAVAIQSAWKGFKARKQYNNLTRITDPPIATVRKFLHLLDQSDVDFQEELKLQKLKAEVVHDIKSNHQTEQALNEMDIKIGLLVKNRIELEDVVKQSKKLKKLKNRDGSDMKLDLHNAGLKSLNKDSRERLNSYQHLFYLLQTNPNYLGTLVFIEQPLDRWSPHKCKTFLEHIIQTTYNYASNSREKYQLLKLYRSAMRREIQDRVKLLKDFITGNPAVIQMVINYHRSSGEGGYLKQVLNPIVTDLLKDEDLDLDTDPINIYHKWIGEEEARTGNPSTLPFDVDRQQALSHAPVVEAVNATVARLIGFASKFQLAIISSLNALPYGLRAISMFLIHDLKEKFPQSPDEDLIKVVGNILYYRFMNPAIIAPEGFDVIAASLDNQITNVQRRNLANIAKLLQFAASGQKFEGDQQHTSELNKFLADAWTKFKTFFQEAATVESLEQFYGIDEYSDATLLSHPVIYISQAEIYYTHAMLESNIEILAPAADDPLRDILKDLGPSGKEDEVVGEEGSPQFAASKAEMSLNLINKFEVPENDDTNVKSLFVRTKRMVIDIIRFQQGKNLKQILEVPASAEEEAQHKAYLVKKKEEQHEMQKLKSADTSAVEQEVSMTTLAELKSKIIANVPALEKEGYCNAANNYQDLLNAVAQDIRNQRNYRRARKQELSKLEHTLTELNKKRDFFKNQSDAYDLYLNSCMEQMTKKSAKGQKRSFLGFGKRSDKDGKYKFGSYKYAASKLKEKGVLISVEGVTDESQLKYINIEISSNESGTFVVEATFMGVKKLEKETIYLQDLLQLQYENVQRMKIFDVCTINVNLLVFLINKKFYNN